MALISSEQLHMATQSQSLIWQAASTAASEAANTLIISNDPIVELVEAADIKAMAGHEQIVIEFALSQTPDHEQAILIDPNLWAGFVGSLDESTTVTPENVLEASKTILEAIIQGVVSGINADRSDPTATIDLKIEQKQFLPGPLDDEQKMVRVSVPLFCGPAIVEAVWIMDAASLLWMLNAPAETAPASPRIEKKTFIEAPVSNRIADDPSLALLMDIPLEVSVELGRVKKLVRDIVELGAGSIVEIDKAAGEPVDILVNRRLVARGEVVVIDDNFGVRITEILNPNERLDKLSEAA